MKNLWIALLLFGAYLYGQSPEKLWIHQESGEGQTPQVWFIEDRETHTRCYAIRMQGMEGFGISCVPVLEGAR